MSIYKKQDKTPHINESTVDRKWVLIDAKGLTLGRLSAEVVRILRGKRKATFTPHCDNGDFVIIINAEQITYTGKNKGQQSKFRRHSGYPGGYREETLDNLLKRFPEKVITNVVNGMLPKSTTLRAKLSKKLKVYKGAEHPHAAQQPVVLEKLPTV